jgi:hypothetical protein
MPKDDRLTMKTLSLPKGDRLTMITLNVPARRYKTCAYP